MLELTRGDILKADAEALVNTVNCVGVMGRGIALQFRKAFPEVRFVFVSCSQENIKRINILKYLITKYITKHFKYSTNV